jgi:uncharacterized membrane protein (TIGR02234 family)
VIGPSTRRGPGPFVRRAGPAAAAVPAAAGGLLCLVASGRVWVRGTAGSPVLGAVPISVSGQDAAPVVPAVALVALAGAVALLLGQVFARRVTGLLLVVAGAAVVMAAAATARAPTVGAGDAVAQVAGASGRLQVASTGWPWVAVLGAVLIGLAGSVAVLRARAWGTVERPVSRFEVTPAIGRSGGGQQPRPGRDPGAAWDALTAGMDPTEDRPSSNRPPPSKSPGGDLPD